MRKFTLIIWLLIPMSCFSKQINTNNILEKLHDTSQISKINAYAECNLLANNTYYSYINGYDTTQLKKIRDSLFSDINWDGNSYWCYVYSINSKFENYYKKRNIRLLISSLEESINTVFKIKDIIDKDSSIERKEDYYGLLDEFVTNIGLYSAKYLLAVGYNKEANKTFKYYFSHLQEQGLNIYSLELVSTMYLTLQEEFEDYYYELEDEHKILPVLDSFYYRWNNELRNTKQESLDYKNILPFFHPSTQIYYENKYNIRFESYFDTLLAQLKTENRLPTQNELKFVSKCYDYFASINNLLIGFSRDTYEKFKTKFKTVYTTDTLNYIMDNVANVHEFPEDKLQLLYDDDFALKYLFQKEIISLRYHNTIKIQRAQYFNEYFKTKKTDINSYLLNRSITDFDKIDRIVNYEINTSKDLDSFDGTIESYNISEFDYRNILLNDTTLELYYKYFEANAFSKYLEDKEAFLTYSRIKRNYDIKGIYDFNPNKKNDFNDFQILLNFKLNTYKDDSVYNNYKYINYARIEKYVLYNAIDLFSKDYYKTNKNTDLYLNVMYKQDKFKKLSLKLKNNYIPEIPYFKEDTKFNKKNYLIKNKVYKLIKNSNKIYTFNEDIGVAINKKTGNHLMFDFEIHKIPSLYDFFYNKIRDSTQTHNKAENDTVQKEALLVFNPNYTKSNYISDYYGNTYRGANEDLKYYLKDSNSDNIIFKQLPASSIEGDEIRIILERNNIKVSAYNEDSATEDKYYIIESPYIMHFATHTYRFNIDTMDAAVYFNNCIVFASANNSIQNQIFDPYRIKYDALLTGFEVLNQDLHNTELIVLSACETAIGTENNIFNYDYQNSLQRAFRLAGAKAVLASKWKVPDKQTQELMVEFYTNWLEKKMTKHKALQQAQLTMSKKYPEPYYWAAWVLYGE